jgi:tetratricopeptide (TPR) repeat protein
MLFFSCSDNAEELEKKGARALIKKDFETALDLFHQAVELNPEYDEALFKRGQCYYGLAEYENALVDFESALKKNPENLPIHFNKGLCLMELKNYKDALLSFEKLEFIQKENPSIYLQKANCHFKLGSYKKAASYYTTSLTYFKDSISINLLRGSSYFQLGQYKKVLADLEYYIPLKETPTLAIEYAAISKFKLEDYAGSISYFDQMIENGKMPIGENLKTMVDALVFSAQDCIAQEDRDQGLELLTRATTLDPLNKDAFYYRGLLFLDMANRFDACMDLNTALKNGQTKALNAMNYSCSDFMH